MLPGAVLDPGVHWNYQAGYVHPDALIWHYTVGYDSRGIGRQGYFALLIARDGTIFQFAPEDSVNWHACFPAGTMIRMADGSHKRVEDVRTLDEVVTAERNTGRVLQTMVRRADQLVNVRLRGHNAFRCTPDHPVLTDRGYVQASELVYGDRVAMPRWGPVASPEVIESAQIVDPNETFGFAEGTIRRGLKTVRVSKLPEVIGLTPDFGRLVGLYLAEGHVGRQTVYWTFGTHEEETLARETVELLKGLGVEATITRRVGNSVVVRAYGTHWARFFSRLCPGTARHGDKRLSPAGAHGPPEYLRAVLEGWLDGDGHRRADKGHVGTTVSKQLAYDMHAIAQALGLRPAIRKSGPHQNDAAATRQERWDVAIATGSGATGAQPQDDEYVWRKVTEVRSEPTDEWVYNLHVEGDNSYVADGCGVHNCEWNQSTQGVEVESIDGTITPEQVRALGWVTLYMLSTFGIPAVFYDGERLPVGFPLVGVTNHRALHEYACAEHYDGYDQWVWDAIMAPAPPSLDLRLVAAQEDDMGMFPLDRTDDGVRWVAGVGYYDHRIYVDRWKRDGTHLDRFDLAGATFDRPSIICDGQTVTVMVRGVDNAQWARTWNGSRWGDWQRTEGLYGNPVTIP